MEGFSMRVKGCRKCVTSMKFNQPIGIELCKDKDYEDQNIEIGRYEGGSSNLTLRPIGKFFWRDSIKTKTKNDISK